MPNTEIDKVIKDAENVVQKGIDTGDIGTGSNQIQSRQNLSSLVTELKKHEIPFYSSVRRVPGSGAAAVFNLQQDVFQTGDTVAPIESFYADGALPEFSGTKYGNLSFEYRQVGRAGSVTGLAQEQMRSFDDMYAREVRNTMTKVARDVEWLSFWSKTSSTPASGVTPFAGLDELITSNVVDANGGVITKDLIDQATFKIAYQGGYDGNHMMYVSHGNAIALDNIYNNDSQVIINQDRGNLTFGNRVTRVRTHIGEMGIQPAYFLNPGTPYPSGNNSNSSAPTGTTLSTIFILPMDYIEISELLPLTKENLAKTNDTERFFVKTYIVPTLTAESYAAKIINVKENVNV